MYHTPAPVRFSHPLNVSLLMSIKQVQQAGNKINVTTAFQSHPTGYGGGYSSSETFQPSCASHIYQQFFLASVNASSSNPLHELSNQFNKNQMVVFYLLIQFSLLLIDFFRL